MCYDIVTDHVEFIEPNEPDCTCLQRVMIDNGLICVVEKYADIAIEVSVMPQAGCRNEVIVIDTIAGIPQLVPLPDIIGRRCDTKTASSPIHMMIAIISTQFHI